MPKKKCDDELSYPGERITKTKQYNLKNGIEINDEIWNRVLALRG